MAICNVTGCWGCASWRHVTLSTVLTNCFLLGRMEFAALTLCSLSLFWGYTGVPVAFFGLSANGGSVPPRTGVETPISNPNSSYLKCRETQLRSTLLECRLAPLLTARYRLTNLVRFADDVDPSAPALDQNPITQMQVRSTYLKIPKLQVTPTQKIV